MNPTVTVARKNNSQRVMTAVAQIAKKQVYVGIPASDSGSRKASLLQLAGETPGIVAKADLMRAAKATPTNAELMFIHSKGSPLKGIPARPVIEPAIVADGNKQAITAELGQAAKAVLDYDPSAATNHLKRAGMAGQRASQKWFTDPRNGWPQNAPSTIRRKSGLKVMGPTPLAGMSASLDAENTPLIDTGALRAAITYVVKEE
jgi:hypothetical protein